MKILVFVLCFCYAALNVTGAALIKSEIANGHPLSDIRGYIQFLFTPKVISGFGVIGVAALVLFKALAMEKFSYVIPISVAINFVLTAFIGYFFFDEKQNLVSLAALGLILSGILVLSLNK